MPTTLLHSLGGKLDHVFAGGVVDSHNRLQRVPALTQDDKALLACNKTEHGQWRTQAWATQMQLHIGPSVYPATAYVSCNYSKHYTYIPLQTDYNFSCTYIAVRCGTRKVHKALHIWRHAVAIFRYMYIRIYASIHRGTVQFSAGRAHNGGS